MHTRLALLTAALLLLSLSTAFAQTRPAAEAPIPDLTAATGLIRLPSAYVQHDSEVSLFTSAEPHSANVGVLAGIDNRVEVGVASRELGGRAGTAFGTAKANLVPEQLLSPAVSVGVVDPFDSGGSGRSGYVVVSKDVIPYFMEAISGRTDFSLKLHTGYGGGMFRRRAFAGVEIIHSTGLGLIGEVVSGRGSAGLRFSRNGFAATAAMLDARDAAGSVSYSLDWR